MSYKQKHNKTINRELDNVARIVNPSKVGKNRCVTSDGQDNERGGDGLEEEFVNVIERAENRIDDVRKFKIGTSDDWAWWALLFFILGIIILVMIIITYKYPTLFNCGNRNLSESFVTALWS